MSQISYEVSELASKMELYFERRERDDGETFYCLGNDAPDYMSDIVRSVHGGVMPDDYKYKFIYFALDYIEEGYNIGDIAVEYADHYENNPTLLDWVKSDLTRMGYVDRAMEEFGVDSLSDALSWGYYEEKREVFNSLIREFEDYTYKLQEAEV